MFNRNQNSEPSLSAVLFISLATWLILVPIVNLISIPMGENKTGVISLASINNISPYTDYLKYLILILTPPLVAVISLNIPTKLENQTLQKWLEFIPIQKIAIIYVIFLLTAWLINIPFDQFKINATLIDSFHEGEFLGFLPNFTQLDKPFINTVLVHGFGLDILPGLIARQLIYNDNGIALTRLFVNLENVITCIGYFWVLWELSKSVQFRKHELAIFLFSCLLFCILDGIFFKFDGRRGTWFILQFALTIRFFRDVELKSHHGKILALIVGASLPSSFLYNYDRAIYFIAVYFCATLLTLFLSREKAKTWLSYSGIGIIASLGLISLLIGFDQVLAIGSQIIYWGKYGRYISFIPLPPLEMTWVSQTFWLSILIQSCVLVYLILDLKRYELKISPFIKHHALTLLLLAAAGVYMRITLDRSDLGHAYHGAIATAFLTFYLGFKGYIKYLEPKFLQLTEKIIPKLLISVLMLYLILAEPSFNIFTAANKLIKLPQFLAQPDTQLLKPDYLEAWQALQPEIDQQSCFYNLTSEGLWYYLFDKPSCSKYSYVLYAQPRIAQNEVIRELDQTQPEILLLTNEMWFQNPWDEVLKTESASLIYRDVLQKYRPYKTVQSHWFWKRSNQNLNFAKTTLTNGYVEFTPSSPIQQKESLSINGWAILPKSRQPADAVYLSLGENNHLISVSPVNLKRPDVAQFLKNPDYEKSGWNLQVPTAILPEGEVILRVWSYDAKTDQLTQIGKDLIVEVSA